MASSTSQITAQSTSGFRKKHSRSPRPMPPQPISPRRTLSLGGGSPARTDRIKGAVEAATVATVEVFRNLRRVRTFIFTLFTEENERNREKFQRLLLQPGD